MAPALLILQPTPYCGLDCRYCYLQTRNDRSRMSADTLVAVARNILGPIPPEQRPTVVWHGGEPTTLPPDWYEQAFALMERESGGHPLSHAFQTNAVGVGRAWTRLWRRWNVSIGVSIDGPADLHDLSRLTRGGRGSHAITMRGIREIQRAGIDMHVITVLTAASLGRADDLYDFYRENGLRRVAFNAEEEEGQTGGSTLSPGADTVTAYRAFIRRFLARAADDPEPVSCREIESVHQMLRLPHEKRGLNPQVMPFEIVTVAVDGGMSTFSPELIGVASPEHGNFVFGNVRDGGLDVMDAHPAFRRTMSEITAGVTACHASCDLFDICGGGTPANKFFELGSFAGTETLYCRLTRRALLETVLEDIERRGPDLVPSDRRKAAS
ncbi:cyclophane-forming radical SAM/SPASM peptide maturase GrrM/OscB [Sulfitobacter sp. LCG007]